MVAFFQFISNYFSIKDERTHKTLRKGPAEDGIYRIPWIALPSLQQGAQAIIRVRISLEDWQAAGFGKSAISISLICYQEFPVALF